MLQLVVGTPRSGKSLYAERLIAASQGTAVYVGTLPDKGIYRETIRAHKARRPTSWGLMELKGVPSADIETVSRALRDHRNVLLDGLTFYLLRLTTLFDFDLDSFRSGVEALATEAARHDGLVVVCDTFISNLLTAEESAPLRYVRGVLMRKAGVITHFKDGAGRTIGRGELIRLERQWPRPPKDKFPADSEMLLSVDARRTRS